jgi:hypothetical protein
LTLLAVRLPSHQESSSELPTERSTLHRGAQYGTKWRLILSGWASGFIEDSSTGAERERTIGVIMSPPIEFGRGSTIRKPIGGNDLRKSDPRGWKQYRANPERQQQLSGFVELPNDNSLPPGAKSRFDRRAGLLALNPPFFQVWHLDGQILAPTTPTNCSPNLSATDNSILGNVDFVYQLR